MLIECRFCLEEVEVEDKKENICSQNSLNNECVGLDSCSGRISSDGFIEFIPITQSKRQRKNIGNRLVKPCDCKGTQTYVHVKCLCEWIGKCNKWYCSICHRVYNLSPHHLHYCVMRLQRKGVLKNLPPIYSNKEFSRSSYFALLIFMGTLSMLMLPSTLHNNNNTSRVSFSNLIDTTTSGFNPFDSMAPPTPYFSFYPCSSSPSIYFSGASPLSSSSSSSFFQSYTNNVLGVQHQNKVYESTLQPYFNSNQAGIGSSMFSSCKLKNHDEKFSSFVCHSSPFVSKSNSDSTSGGMNPNSQNQQFIQYPNYYSFNIPNEINNLNKAKEQPSIGNKKISNINPDDEPLLKKYNFIHNIQNYQPTTKEIQPQSIQQRSENSPIITQTSKSPINNHNIYFATQRNNKITSLKNIFCTVFPIEQICY
ncbi:hypothetical protein DICPUDRAFT_98631 [Dictyostelium purpureum]|uniref:RING-CH-type domain-containing protein n=1 Tax=Dictyostelium purpureum TaxID=5786 RepID=F0ZS75_DICPU|nr:uncharacterized protein DICPUDRAFT_98631 [Dictyostelium purpureum]EGC33187.1 hypothetical protein DICPUDRAFT_98631 [Dictyostelium purpureum]|eukprot:XP_003290269.1 hypothetical protein DICPUDRAFT_98631 [Dictyostelium purpureum]